MVFLLGPTVCFTPNPDYSSLVPAYLPLLRPLRAPKYLLMLALSLTLGLLRVQRVHLPILASLLRTRAAFRFRTCGNALLALPVSLYPVISLTAAPLSAHRVRSTRLA